MIKPLDSIIIVGGGSAGWMTASAMIRAFPEKSISVIESPDIPIVGVGESTLGGINDFIKYLGIQEEDFMKHTNASYKMSIKFTDFYEKDAGGFHYPFGQPYLEGTLSGLNDWFVKKHYFPDTPVQDFVDCYFPASALWNQNKFCLNKYNQFDNYDDNRAVAYHFDAVKFGAWLRDHYCLPKGVKLITDTVDNIPTNENGIEKLVLKSGDIVSADLYIDCTGFKSLLLGETLGVPFDSYADMLPNNRAWATQVPYIDQEAEMEPFTDSKAIGHGWVWNIPSWERLGTGYVYSDKFIDPEDAKEEFKQHLMSDKMICPRTREQVDNLKFKDISMRVGIHDETFVKNVVAIGLSAGFIEPLESNGLFTVHEFLFKLIKILQRPAVTQWDRDVYNGSVYGMWRNFAEFVASHYALSIRNDTEYWKANANRVYKPGMKKLEPQTANGFYQTQDNKMFTGRVEGIGGINWISTGCHWFMLDNIHVTAEECLSSREDILASYTPVFENFENNKIRWYEAAKNAPSLYQYLKDNVYKEDN